LGSNLDDPRRHVSTALRELATVTSTRVSTVSSLYRSAPMVGLGVPADQPAYINAVARLETRLSAEALLDALQAIEARHGRVRSGERWGPRTLDLDLLLYGDARIDTPRLRVPHPGIAERNFVLYPLAEIAPELEIPGLGTVRERLTQCPSAELERLAEQKQI
ncbi:MAG: 2-amino-4-hydroxy-6-hydroxymethyldihydropteridine diphosphokinase, partial [Gammaproteobacteria bacterium]|nr:2-amino-4-hydroxy-6-hydroxymethyldihydropteridine diphosphokinase [Gammaproteobacteria bacterium]